MVDGIELVEFNDGYWTTYDVAGLPHTLGIRPSLHDPNDGECRWAHHGKNHNECGPNWKGDFSKYWEWSLYGQNLHGRLLLW